MNAKEKETSSPYSGLVGTGGERIVRCNHCMKTFEEHEIPDNDGIDVCPYCGKTDALMDIGMAQMNAKEFIAKLLEDKGVDITVAAVRHHARLGRIGYRHDGRWVFDQDDIERMMEYAGKQGPKKGLVIKKLGWDKITSTRGDGSVLVRYCCKLFESITATVRFLVELERWEWEIECGNNGMVVSGMCDTATDATADCEKAWHDLLMIYVLEVGK